MASLADVEVQEVEHTASEEKCRQFFQLLFREVRYLSLAQADLLFDGLTEPQKKQRFNSSYVCKLLISA